MQTQVLKVNEASLTLAGELFHQGQTVAFPTETVYGLGAWAMSEEGIRRIYEAKGRPSDNPLIVHIAPGFDLTPIVSEVPDTAKTLMDTFWPGPLTLIMPKAETISDHVTGGLSTVAVREPSHPLAMKLMQFTGLPLVAPSANTSGRPSPTTAAHVYEDLNGKIPLILDGGPCSVGLESTIVDCTQDPPMVLRPGAITLEMIRELYPEAVEDPAVKALKTLPKGVVPKAPGMKYRHYAPKGYLVVSDEDAVHFAHWMRQDLEEGKAKRIAVIVSDELKAQILRVYRQERDEKTPGKLLFYPLGSRTDPQKIARTLFADLRRADDEGVTRIYGEAFDRSGLGEAIMNRFYKASAEKRLKGEQA